MRLALRSVVAALAAATVLAYGAAGHAAPQFASHEGMAGSTLGLCLLLATFIVRVVTPRPAAAPRALRTVSVPTASSAWAPAPVDGRARASPSALQRFRN
jgi:hypothetical protein